MALARSPSRWSKRWSLRSNSWQRFSLVYGFTIDHNIFSAKLFFSLFFFFQRREIVIREKVMVAARNDGIAARNTTKRSIHCSNANEACWYRWPRWVSHTSRSLSPLTSIAFNTRHFLTSTTPSSYQSWGNWNKRWTKNRERRVFFDRYLNQHFESMDFD